MRFGAIACGVLLAGCCMAGEAAAMRLATFDFEGAATFGHEGQIKGSFTLDLDAAETNDFGSHRNAVTEFTVEFTLSSGVVLNGEFSPNGHYSRGLASPHLFPYGVTLEPFERYGAFGVTAPLSGTTVFFQRIPETIFRDAADVYLAATGIEFSAFCETFPEGSGGLSVDHILSLANQGMTFRFFGALTETETSGVASVSSDLIIFEPEPRSDVFYASGSIQSVTQVSQVPLPAAAWLMLSGLAALAGVRVWPRAKISGGTS